MNGEQNETGGDLRVSFESLRQSIELETRADLFAIACDFRNASALMREANAIRKRVFGAFDPNELRERTMAALAE